MKDNQKEIADIITRIFSMVSDQKVLGPAAGVVLSRLGIVVSYKIPTMAVSGNGYFIVNPKFMIQLKEYAKKLKEYVNVYYSDEYYEYLMYIFGVAHELYHILAGHVMNVHSVPTDTEHRRLNIAEDRWANKFAAETIMNIKYVNRKHNETIVIVELSKAVRKKFGDWNTFMEEILPGLVSDHILEEIAKKAGEKPPDFDKMTSKEIYNWLLEMEYLEEKSRTSIKFSEHGGSIKSYVENYNIDVYYRFDPDDEDYVIRKPEKTFEEAQSKEELDKIWENIISEAEAVSRATGVGTDPGNIKAAFEYEKKKPVMDYKRLITASVAYAYSAESTEDPNVFDENYELFKEFDPSMDKNTFMYGTRKFSKSPPTVLIDTSGSMYSSFSDVASEIDNVLSSKGIKGIIKVEWDAKVQNVEFVKKLKDKKVPFSGFGGTSPVPALKMLLGKKVEGNEEWFSTYWKLARRHKANKFVIFISDFEFFEEDVKESVKLIKRLEARGYKFAFINIVTKVGTFIPGDSAKAFLEAGNFSH